MLPVLLPAPEVHLRYPPTQAQPTRRDHPAPFGARCCVSSVGVVDCETVIRYVGLVLVLVGLGTTAAGIVDVRRRFTDRPGVMGSARAKACAAVLAAPRRLTAGSYAVPGTRRCTR